MIIVKLKGGLGNQMFQYALGRRLSLLNKTSLYLDTSSFDSDELRSYSLNCFNVVENFIKDKDLEKFIKYRKKGGKLKGLFHNLFIADDKKYYIEKYSKKIDRKVFKLKGNFYVDGYWQSEKYFLEIGNIIREEFTLKEMGEEARAIKNKIKKEKNSISLHIRRGDYVTNPTAKKVLGLCPLDYYKKAIKYLIKENKNGRVFVFSDDIKWVEANLKMKEVFFVSSPEIKPEEDLILMSCCKHNIIANSSFSWWGAWMNKNQDKVVIAPQKWFQQQEEGELIPLSWVRL